MVAARVSRFRGAACLLSAADGKGVRLVKLCRVEVGIALGVARPQQGVQATRGSESVTYLLSSVGTVGGRLNKACRIQVHKAVGTSLPQKGAAALRCLRYGEAHLLSTGDRHSLRRIISHGTEVHGAGGCAIPKQSVV